MLIARGRPNHSDILRWMTLLRDRPEFQAAVMEDIWFVRAEQAAAKDAARVLSLLPNAELFELDEQLRLTPVGKSLPVDVLPEEIEWKPFRQLTRLWLPNSLHCHGMNGELAQTSNRLPLRWRPSEQLSAPEALLCSFADWTSFVLKNLQPKWRSLRFGCSQASEPPLNTLVVGSPIPSIPGTRLVSCERILMPVAHTWFPAVPAQSIRKLLRVKEADWILWDQEDSLEVVSDSDLIPTTRVSIRTTAHAFADANP